MGDDGEERSHGGVGRYWGSGADGKGLAYAGAKGEVAAETHARRADETGAGRQTEEVVDCLSGVFIVGLEGLHRRSPGQPCQSGTRQREGRRTARLWREEDSHKNRELFHE